MCGYGPYVNRDINAFRSEATSINQLVCFYSVHDEKFDFSSSPKRKNSKDVYKKDIRKGVW